MTEDCVSTVSTAGDPTYSEIVRTIGEDDNALVSMEVEARFTVNRGRSGTDCDGTGTFRSSPKGQNCYRSVLYPAGGASGQRTGRC